MAASQTPRLIGDRYEVVDFLGEGASSRTYLCIDTVRDERVAVKELRLENLDDWKSLELFEREGAVLARLDHPGIPKVHDYFRLSAESTSLFIVQDFLDGESLGDRIGSGLMLGRDEVRQITLDLLDILDYLHGRVPPVLHRDIKPSNIIIRPGGASLVDFGGVAHGWRTAEHDGHTVVGTFGYMPQEQLLGQAGPSSDLYALGATLLHVVTGQQPTQFSFDSGRIEVPANLPVDRSLARLIEALLRPAPRDRPQSAASARALLLDTSPVTPIQGQRSGQPATALAPRLTSAVTISHGPRFVDMSDPFRDPKGEYADVYSNLTNPLFPRRRLWSQGVHVIWALGFGMFSLLSLRTAPLVYASKIRRRRANYLGVFQTGDSTKGVIVSVDEGTLYATFKYEFSVAGQAYAGEMEYAQEMTQFWGVGDAVPVLYDPEDPRLNCFVYR